MADFRDPHPPPGAGGVEPLLGRLLSDDAVWGELDDADGNGVVAAIAAEASAPGRAGVRGPGRSRPRRWTAPVATGVAAAVLVLVIASLAGDTPRARPPGVDVPLAGTAIAPEASAVATVSDTPLGTRIDLAVTGLPPAPPGQYYEAWLRQDAEVGVSAGSFHLRGGDGSIELWAGVAIADYPLMTVTLESEDDGPEPSGRTVLRGTSP